MTEKSNLDKKAEGKTEIVGGVPMTPEEAQENRRQVVEESKNISEPPVDRNVPEDDPMNAATGPREPAHGTSGQPETIRSARVTEKESGASKAKRVDTADPDPAGEAAPAGWGKKPSVYVMTDVNGEKLYVTVKQWQKYGQKLRAKGWTTPEFAEGDPGGNEDIPQDVDWGKDAPEEALYSPSGVAEAMPQTTLNSPKVSDKR